MNYNEKIERFKKLSNEELSIIIKDIESNEIDIIMASIEKGDRDYNMGHVYTTKEVKERIFGKNIMARRNYWRSKPNL